jgi:hypothetical protein
VPHFQATQAVLFQMPRQAQAIDRPYQNPMEWTEKQILFLWGIPQRLNR